MDLALNKLQWLICHKTQNNPTQPNPTQPINMIVYLVNVANIELSPSHQL